jgi:hypothetical protein
MHIGITRYGSIPGVGTFGRLHVGPHDYGTVEREWLNNEAFKSCVPAGSYQLVPHNSKKYGPVWALVNLQLGVAHERTDGVKRYACLIHRANWPKDVVGCIGVGRHKFLPIIGELGVPNSRECIEELRQWLRYDDTHTLHIRWLDSPE